MEVDEGGDEEGEADEVEEEPGILVPWMLVLQSHLHLVALVGAVAPDAQDGAHQGGESDLATVLGEEEEGGDAPEEHGVLQEEDGGEPHHSEPHVARRRLPPGGVHAWPGGVGEGEEHQERGSTEERHASQDI